MAIDELLLDLITRLLVPLSLLTVTTAGVVLAIAQGRVGARTAESTGLMMHRTVAIESTGLMMYRTVAIKSTRLMMHRTVQSFAHVWYRTVVSLGTKRVRTVESTGVLSISNANSTRWVRTGLVYRRSSSRHIVTSPGFDPFTILLMLAGERRLT